MAEVDLALVVAKLVDEMRKAGTLSHRSGFEPPGGANLQWFQGDEG